MSLDEWTDKDLLPWVRETLPTFLLASLPDHASDATTGSIHKCHVASPARTPWEGLELVASEVAVEGEAHVCGKKGHLILEFELDVGIGVDIKKDLDIGKGLEHRYWFCIVHLLNVSMHNLTPEVMLQVDQVREDFADEVGWYLREGPGKEALWSALVHWQASARRKWLDSDTAVAAPQVPCVSFPVLRCATEEPSPSADKVQKHREPTTEITSDSALAVCELPRSSDRAWAEASQHTDTEAGEQLLAEGLAKHLAALPSPSCKHAAEMRRGRAPAKDFVLFPHGARRRAHPSLSARTYKERFASNINMPSLLAGVGGPAVHLIEKDLPKWLTHSEVAGSCASSATGIAGAAVPRGKEAAVQLCEGIEREDFISAFWSLSSENVNLLHNKTGRNALHSCAACNSLPLLHMVVHAKADLNMRNSYGRTALMMAAVRGNTNLVEALLDAGADASITDSWQRSAEDLAAHETMRKAIAERVRPTKYGQILLDAIDQKDIRTAEAAIEAGGDVNHKDSKGDSPLIRLAKGKWRKEEEELQVRLGRICCEAGASVNFQNSNGDTALFFAAHRGKQAIVEILLELRADVGLTNKEGNSALMYAAHAGHESVCKVLLEARAPPGCTNHAGLTAELMAEKRGFRRCAVLVQGYVAAPKDDDEDESTAAEASMVRGASSSCDDDCRWNALEKLLDEQFDEREDENQGVWKQTAMAAMRGEPLAVRALRGPVPGEELAAAMPLKVEIKKGDLDYSKWDRIVDDIERLQEMEERAEFLEQNPEYEWRDGQRMRTML